MKKIILLSLIATVFGAMMVGCSPAAEEGAKTDDAAATTGGDAAAKEDGS